MKYKPWGEVRSTWKSSDTNLMPSAYALTRQTFTGQYSYMDDPSTAGVTEGFGLMFYNARWMDPYTGRFVQADSIVPAGVQGLDRYAYVNNSPVNFTDPTGHDSWWCSSELCNYQVDYSRNPDRIQGYLNAYHVTTNGLTSRQNYEAGEAAIYAGQKLYSYYGRANGFTSNADAFIKLVGAVTIQTRTESRCETQGSVISCGSNALYMTAFLHEFGHVFDNHFGDHLSANLYPYNDFAGNPIDGGYGNPWIRTTDGFKCAPREDCLEHAPSMGYDYAGCNVGEAQMSNCARQEQFADLFMNWVLDGAGDPNHGFVGDQGEGRVFNFQFRLLPRAIGLYLNGQR